MSFLLRILFEMFGVVLGGCMDWYLNNNMYEVTKKFIIVTTLLMSAYEYNYEWLKGRGMGWTQLFFNSRLYSWMYLYNGKLLNLSPLHMQIARLVMHTVHLLGS